MGFKLGRTDSMSKCMKLNEIDRLDNRREDLDYDFSKRVAFDLYGMELDDIITFNNSYQARYETVNSHLGVDQFKFSFFYQDEIKS